MVSPEKLSHLLSSQRSAVRVRSTKIIKAYEIWYDDHLLSLSYLPTILTINDGGLATESKTELLSLDECTLGNSFDRCATSGAFFEGFPRKAFPLISS